MRRFVSVIAVGALLALSATAAAQSLSSVYVLGERSSLAQGCIPPCLCPVFLSPSFRGTFELVKGPSPIPSFENYTISAVNWLADTPSGELRLVGSGTYRVGHQGGQTVQEMVLLLSLNGERPISFESGLVPGGTGGPHPAIDLSLVESGAACFATFFHVAAAAVTAAAIVPYGVLPGSIYEEGCQPPCACPIFAQGLRGSFGLVPILHLPRRDEFGVVALDWQIYPFPPSPLPYFIPVSGSGIYTIERDAAGVLHRMILDASIGGNPDHFDSGLVPGTDLPRIDIALAVNGFFCYDKVFDLHAAPR